MNSRLPIHFEKKDGTSFSHSDQKIGITVFLFAKHRIKHQYSLIKTPCINFPAQSQADVNVLCSKILNHTFHTLNQQNLGSCASWTSCVFKRRFQRNICPVLPGTYMLHSWRKPGADPVRWSALL